jgi:hypothetical protein
MQKLISRRILPIAGLLFLLGFMPAFNTIVTGSVNPPDAGMRAWLFSSTDTVTATVESNGHFQIPNVKPGNYRLMIEGRPPYRNGVKDGIHVTDGQPLDVGVIEMQK